MHTDNPHFASLPRATQWAVNLLGQYAERELEIQYNPNGKVSPISFDMLCHDRRRLPTVYRELHEMKLIDFSHKLVISEIERALPAYSIEPTFEITGFKTKNTYYTSASERAVVAIFDKGDTYKEVHSLSPQELIHLYLNQSEYDFKVFKTTTVGGARSRHYYNNNHESSYDKFELKILPVALLETTDDSIISAQVKEYAASHAQAVLTEALGESFTAIDNEKPYITIEEVTKRREQVKGKIDQLNKVLSELNIVERELYIKGDGPFNDLIQKSCQNYLELHAALWINSKEKEEQNLSKLFLKGSILETEHKVFR